MTTFPLTCFKFTEAKDEELLITLESSASDIMGETGFGDAIHSNASHSLGTSLDNDHNVPEDTPVMEDDTDIEIDDTDIRMELGGREKVCTAIYGQWQDAILLIVFVTSKDTQPTTEEPLEQNLVRSGADVFLDRINFKGHQKVSIILVGIRIAGVLIND